jgi:hypothetical protein
MVRMSSYTLEQLDRIASLIQRDTVIFLTASNWGRLAGEIMTKHPDDLTDKGNKPTPSNFKRLNLRGKHILTATNSGSDDEGALDAALLTCADKGVPPTAIVNAARVAAEMVEGDVVERLREAIAAG